MPQLSSSPSQGSPSSSYGFPTGPTCGRNTARRVQNENVQPGPSKKRKSPASEGIESRPSKKVKTSHEVGPSTATSRSGEFIRPKRPACSSSNAARPLSASQQRRIRAKIAACSIRQSTRMEVVPWQVPEEVDVPKESVVSTAEPGNEAVKRDFGEQLAEAAANTVNPVPDQSFRTWRNNEEKFRKMTSSTRGGGVEGLLKSRNGNIIRPPKPPVPRIQEAEINKGRGRALTSAQIRRLMQCRTAAPSENKLYKPRYKVHKSLCPGQDSRTLPMNLLDRLRDGEPESVSSAEIAMMKELVRPNVEKIKRRTRRAVRESNANKVKELAARKAWLDRKQVEFAAWTARASAIKAGASEPNGGALQHDVHQEHKINVRISGAVEMTLEAIQHEYQTMETLFRAGQTSKRKRDDDADEDVAELKGKRPQREGPGA